MGSAAVKGIYPRRFCSAEREAEGALREEEPERALVGLGACLAWPEKLYRLVALAEADSRLEEAARAVARDAGLAAELPFPLALLPWSWPFPFVGAADFALQPPLDGLGACPPLGDLAALPPLALLAKLRAPEALREPLEAVPRGAGARRESRLWAGFALRVAVFLGALGRGLRGLGAGALTLAGLAEAVRATGRFAVAGSSDSRKEVAAEAATSRMASTSASTSTVV